MRRAACLLIAIALLLSSCGDKTVVNNYYGSETATVTGRVYPTDDAIAVLVEAEGINVAVDEDGVFIIRDLPPGTHDIVIQPTKYSKRIMFNVLVMAGQLRDLGKFQLSNLPYPIYILRPTEEDLERDPHRTTDVRLYTDESLNIDDLNSRVTIVPDLAGSWREHVPSSRQSFQYYFLVETSPLPVGLVYDFTIPASVRTRKGIALGKDVAIQFKTNPLLVSSSVSHNGRDRTVSVSFFQAQIAFNADVALDSVEKAVTFVPAIGGRWLTNDQPGSRRFNFFKTSSEALTHNIEYM